MRNSLSGTWLKDLCKQWHEQGFAEIARGAGHEAIGLASGGRHRLNGILEIEPAGMGSLRSKPYFLGLA